MILDRRALLGRIIDSEDAASGYPVRSATRRPFRREYLLAAHAEDRLI